MAYKFIGGYLMGGQKGLIANGNNDIELIGTKVVGDVALDLNLSKESNFISTDTAIEGRKIAVLIRDWNSIVDDVASYAKQDGLNEAQYSEVLNRLIEIKDTEKSKEMQKLLIDKLINFVSSIGSGLLVVYIKQLFSKF
ncbi:hypothetical protein HFE03_07380 [Paenibacillus sp. EKM102P]|uniref:hypothetical protein n=1 Tax=unclassified Paenibacillus TaxID=185978 RepID=UPI00142DB093|nr:MULTISPECIES: hypothetical protein [unclassified Paenibacillus]KAF6620468.1 hypothetical protein HFE00_05285 [Paenibacillus sp. EKM101P]KAF6623460.1 hypothetical protein HFE03_07380 [Paenibacillus sp. EKM102P]KAF6633978.1 hypothetical protein HFE01_07130 [Paenibacillus sp. EKM10P]KAF6649504.1 hypothetical protein HFE02_02090 [Paenibacillus sp. EKM11P]